MKDLGITGGIWTWGLLGGKYCINFKNKAGFWGIENINDAKLIADSGTTANKCGLLPSELLEQRDSLAEALQHTLEIMYQCDPPKELFETYANAFANYTNLLSDVKP